MSFREAFWVKVCRYGQYYYLLLALMTTLLIMDLLLIVWLQPVEEDLGAALMALVMFVATILGCIGVLWQCQRD